MTIEKKIMEGAAGVAGGNYFGSGADGALTTSGDVTHTVLNKNGSYDGDMVVKNYTDLTISAGDTMTVDQPCRGFLLYVKGDLVINGTIDMDNKGPSADPEASGGSDSSVVNASGLRLAMFTASGTESLSAADFAGCGDAAVAAVANQPEVSGDGAIFSIGRQGAAGGGGGACNCAGASGGAGTAGSNSLPITNGGGGGGEGTSDGSSTGTGGSGSYGGPWGGGSGGGGAFRTGPAGSGGAWGGAGGSGATENGNNGSANGGSGNPGGNGVGISGLNGLTGTGGSIWVIVKGDVTIDSAGTINARGQNGNPTGGGRRAGGGGTGGGTIMMLYGGTLTGFPTYISAAGGNGGGGWGGTGGAGGNGGYYSAQVTVG